MQVVDPGHQYKLATIDGDLDVILTFVKREGPGFPGNVGHHPGTTVQEVLRALIDRCGYLYNQIPSAETESAEDLLKTVLMLFEIRAARRHERKFDHPSLNSILKSIPCPECLHVGCENHVVCQ